MFDSCENFALYRLKQWKSLSIAVFVLRQKDPSKLRTKQTNTSILSEPATAKTVKLNSVSAGCMQQISSWLRPTICNSKHKYNYK